MEAGLEHLHNFLRWLVLIFGLLALITGGRGIGGGRDFTNGDKRTGLYFLITMDLQLLVGLALYFIGPWGFKVIQGAGMGEVMKNAANRFWAIEHPIMMVLAVILVHIGYAGTKGNRPHRAKFRRLFWCTLIALILILAAIPWPFRAGVGRPWFPGMGM